MHTKTIATALTIFWLACFAPASATQRPPQPQTGSLQGVVVKTGIADVTIQFPAIQNKSNVAPGVGEPLGGVTLELTAVDADRVRSYTAKTGRDGKFEFRDVLPGTGYQLVAIHPDYLPGQYGQQFPGTPGTPLTLPPGGRLTDLRIALTPESAISGRVLSPNGVAVRSWRLLLIRPFYVGGQRVLGSLPTGKNGVVAMATTDNRGEYRFTGLPPGQYYIGDALGNFYAGRAAEPAPIHLRPGEILKGVDLRVRATSRTLSGRIVDVNGRRVPAAEIALVRRDSAAAATPPRFRDTEASFSITTDSPASQLVLAKASANGLSLFGYAEVESGNSDVAAISVVVAPPSDISGLVTGAPGARLSVSLHPLLPGMATAPVIGVSPGFIAGIPAGDYRVDIGGAPGAAYIQTIRFDSAEVRDGVIRLRGQPGQLEIAMGANGGVLAGRVVDETGQPAPNVRTVLAPEGERRSRFDLYKAVFTDKDGRFELHGIAPGDYKVFAWLVAPDDAWRDRDFMMSYEDAGKLVRIEEGIRATIEVQRISPWR
jgi:hypothetical protein